MEKLIVPKSETNGRTGNLTCWDKDDNVQCLRVELSSGEQALFPYGYFERARFIRGEKRDVVELRFKDAILKITGLHLEALWMDLQSLSVASVKPLSSRFAPLTANHSCVEEISIHDGQPIATDNGKAQ